MILHSDRWLPGDLESWLDNERFDAAFCQLSEMEHNDRQALRYLREFAERPGGGYLGVSWGKDSVVAAHLLVRSGLKMPVVWIKIWPLYNPDCERVRDAFLRDHDIDYHEIAVEWHPDQVQVWRDLYESGSMASAGYSPIESAGVQGFKEAARRFGARHVSGVRGEESGVRRIRMNRWGAMSKNTCAPIGYWSSQHVYAYLHKHGLPVHPAYAMTMGGVLDRKQLRVDALGGGMGRQRAEWEGMYYADRVAEIGRIAKEILSA